MTAPPDRLLESRYNLGLAFCCENTTFSLRTEARAALNKSHFKTPKEREEEDLAYMKKVCTCISIFML